MASGRGLAALVLLAGLASGKILMFENKDPKSAHYHSHTETLAATPSNKSTSPYVSFDVKCPAGASKVLWMVVNTDLRGIGRWHEENDTIISARCGADIVPTCDGGTGDPDDAVTTDATDGGRRRGKKNKKIPTTSTTMSASEETTAMDDAGDGTELGTEEPMSSSPADEETPADDTSSGPTVGLPVDQNGTSHADSTKNDPSHPSVTGSYCHLKSGLLFSREYANVVVGGCVLCDSDVEHYERINAPVFRDDGFYTLWLESVGTPTEEQAANPNSLVVGPKITGKSVFRNVNGFLSETLVPLMTFYGVLGLFYLLFGILWLILMVCHYKDILRLQFWIGAVIGLGELEMAVSYADLYSLNQHGERSQSLMVASKIIYSSKNTLARLLVLIVAMGYGVVRPRLGGALKQIVAIGVAYFFLAAAYGVMHALGQTESKEQKTEMMVIIPLSVLDAAIFWWIFISLSHTMKTLRLRKNEVKLGLYSRFQWALIFCIAATIVFTAWSMYDKFGYDELTQLPDWRNAWWQDGYWHMLFFGILVVIMILWRPTTNNQRYAYSALETDLEEDEEYRSVVPHFGADAMKMRTFSARGMAAPEKEEADEDLRWVEENIPSTTVTTDNAFPNLPMDSDEELMDTKFQQSKME